MERQLLIKGRYQILRELGAGGSGCVYAARDTELEREVAVKLFGLHVRWDRSAREKFELEVKVSGRVKSKYIVQVHDAGLDPMTQMRFIVMELLNGQNLQQVVEAEQRLGPRTTVEYLRQVASCLDKAHSWKDQEGQPAPIVHRDLKPSNLFLAEYDDSASLIKILDWGIAKMLSSSATQSTDLRGTPLYMAPERFQELPITAATDIWNLGLVAFFMLTGKHYWRAGQNPNVVWPALSQEVTEGPTVPPRARIAELGLDVTLPPAFDSWFMHCTHSAPERRYPTAGEAVRTLAEVFMPSVSELISHAGGLDINSPTSASEAGASQPQCKPASSSVDGGIAKTPLPPAPVRPKRWHWAVAGTVLGGSLSVLLYAVQNWGSSNPVSPEAEQTPASTADSALLARADMPIAPNAPTTPAATSPAVDSTGVRLTQPVTSRSGESRATTIRATPAAIPAKSAQSTANLPAVPRQTSPALSPVSTPANPDPQIPLEQKIQELRDSKKIRHP